IARGQVTVTKCDVYMISGVLEATDFGAKIQRSPAEPGDQGCLQVGAGDEGNARAVALRDHVHRDVDELMATPVADRDPVDCQPSDLDAQRLQRTCAVGPDHQSGAALSQPIRALENLYVHARVAQRDCSGKTPDAGADDERFQTIERAHTSDSPSGPNAIFEIKALAPDPARRAANSAES